MGAGPRKGGQGTSALRYPRGLHSSWIPLILGGLQGTFQMRLSTALLSAAGAAMVTVLLACPAVATDSWKSGFGQGIHEAYVEKGPGNEIYVACTAGASRPSTSIRFMLGGNSPPENSLVTLTFDGEVPLDVGVGKWGELRSDCHACASTFDLVIERLKSKQSVHVRYPDGVSAVFPLTGSAAAIGNECIADFWVTY